MTQFPHNAFTVFEKELYTVMETSGLDFADDSFHRTDPALANELL